MTEPAFVTLLKLVWRVCTQWGEIHDLAMRRYRCENCDVGDWCDRHAYHGRVLAEAGPDLYWAYADYLDREGYPAIYRIAREYADREKRSRK